MFPKRPRIAGFSYIGFHRYSLTICTSERKPLFSDAETVDAVLTTIRRSAEAHGFAVLACCFMPDHVHLIVGASSESADLQKSSRTGNSCLVLHTNSEHVNRSGNPATSITSCAMKRKHRAPFDTSWRIRYVNGWSRSSLSTSSVDLMCLAWMSFANTGRAKALPTERFQGRAHISTMSIS